MPGSTPGRTAHPSSRRPHPRGSSEFDVIARYFAGAGAERNDVVFGVGDDAALLGVERGAKVIARSRTVSLLAGHHEDAAALSTRLVDEAAAALEQAGASPCWATLALTMPGVDENWLQTFADTLDKALRANNIALVGGDTTRGPLAITLSLIGTKHGGTKHGQIANHEARPDPENTGA